MVFNKSQTCRDLITNCAKEDFDDDQKIMNRLALTKYRKNIGLLPYEYFPNGNVYYKKGIKNKAIIVHNNWMVGLKNKINSFKEEGLWYI